MTWLPLVQTGKVPEGRMPMLTCDVEDFLGVIGEDDGGFAAVAQDSQHGPVPVTVHNLFSLLSVVSAFHCYLHFYSKRVRKIRLRGWICLR